MSIKAVTRPGRPAEFVLATLRAFPSLEPRAVQPVSAQLLGLPTRRDVLWQAVVYERDAARVGSKTILGRSDMGYSKHKLRPQKGSGRARMGDRGNPIRHDGGRAHNKHAPIDHSTGLPSTVYALAVRTALSMKYREGHLYVIDGAADFAADHVLVGKDFLKQHSLEKTSVTFVVDSERSNLFDATADCERVDIVPKECVTVQDLLRPRRLIVERGALEYLAVKYQPPRATKPITPAPPS